MDWPWASIFLLKWRRRWPDSWYTEDVWIMYSKPSDLQFIRLGGRKRYKEFWKSVSGICLCPIPFHSYLKIIWIHEAHSRFLLSDICITHHSDEWSWHIPLIILYPVQETWLPRCINLFHCFVAANAESNQTSRRRGWLLQVTIIFGNAQRSMQKFGRLFKNSPISI